MNFVPSFGFLSIKNLCDNKALMLLSDLSESAHGSMHLGRKHPALDEQLINFLEAEPAKGLFRIGLSLRYLTPQKCFSLSSGYPQEVHIFLPHQGAMMAVEILVGSWMDCPISSSFFCPLFPNPTPKLLQQVPCRWCYDNSIIDDMKNVMLSVCIWGTIGQQL